VDIYWASPSELKEKIDRILYKAGSKAIVTDAFPAAARQMVGIMWLGRLSTFTCYPDHNEGDGK